MVTLILLLNQGVKSPPKKTILWSWIGVYKSNAQNIKTFILSKVLQWFQPNLAQRYRPPSSLRGWSQYTPDKSKMAGGRHFKSPRVSNRLTNFGDIWHGDTNWPPTYWIFEKPRWRRLPSWKSQKNRDISATARPILNLVRWCKMGLLTASNPLALNCSEQHQPQVELR